MPKPLLTVGIIARRLGASLHRIEYIIRSRGIEAFATAGNARVYSEEAVDLIARELASIDSARSTEAHPLAIVSAGTCEPAGATR